jgi:rhodanese-related sulfurtransferase
MAKQDITSMPQFYNLMKFQPYLLDVRTEEEYCQSHLCSAINIDMSTPKLLHDIEKRLIKYGITNKHALLFVYCKRGIRANSAKTILQKLGYKNVMSLGGIETEPLKSAMNGEMTTLNKQYIKICKCKK